MDGNSNDSARRDRQLAALVACLVVVAGFVVYWSTEIAAVREMLKLAYG